MYQPNKHEGKLSHKPVTAVTQVISHLLPAVAPSVDSTANTLASSFLYPLGGMKELDPSALGDVAKVFKCGDAGGTFLSFSASSPVGIGPSMREGGPNRSSGCSRNRGKSIP